MDRAGLAVAALAACCSAASAHGVPAPKQDELRVSPSEIVVTIAYQVPRGDLARALRRIFDRDRDGALDAAETARLGAHLAREATAFLALTVDGKAAAFAVGPPVVDAAGPADDAIAVTVQATARVPLAVGAHQLRFADHHKDRRFGIPLRVVFERGTAPKKKLPPEPFVDEKHAFEIAIAVS